MGVAAALEPFLGAPNGGGEGRSKMDDDESEFGICRSQGCSNI